MFAVFKTGGKQYKVQKDSKLLIEKIEGKAGDEVVLNNVLMIGDGENLNIGTPNLNDAAVVAEVIKQTRGPKITIIYKRRRKNSRRKQGHKQNLTLIKVKEISPTGGSKIQPKKAAVKEEKIKITKTKKVEVSKNKPSKEKKAEPKSEKDKKNKTAKKKTINNKD